MTGNRRIWAAIFLTSLAALSFEILLLRIFSITLWHHFASMVLSIAMLGIAASGTFISVLRERFGRTPVLRPRYFLLLGLVMPLSYGLAATIPFDPVKLAWDGSQLLWISGYYLTLGSSFLIAGFIIASAFATRGESAGSLYAADLVGGAAGAVLILLLQMLLSPGRAVVCAALLPLLAALLCGSRHVRAGSLLAAALLIGLTIMAPDLLEPKMSPYKELPTLLRMHGSEHLSSHPGPYGQVDLFTSPGNRYAPGLSLRYRGDLPDQIGVAIDGGSVTTLTLSAANEELEYLDYLPGSLAYRLRPGAKVFLIDPRGGLPLILARRHGATVEGCAESQPAVPAALRKSGQGYVPPCGNTGLARNALARGQGRYDIIELPLTGALPSAQIGGGADYSLTVEAVETYLEVLGDDGILNVSLYINPPFRAELRMFTTLLQALENSGAAEPRRHVVALRSLGVLVLLACPRPFTEGEIEVLNDFADALWFDPVWHEGMKDDVSSRHIRSRAGDLAQVYRSLGDPDTRHLFARGYLFDITAPDDGRPFFHDFLRIRTLGEVFRLVDGKWDFFITEGGLLPAIFLQVMLLGLLLVVLPAFVSSTVSGKGGVAALVYFAALGVAYMLVEVALIERLTLPLEHPVLAFAVVVSALLAGSGLGSWQTRSLAAIHLPKAAAAAALFSVLALFASDVVPPLLLTSPPVLRWSVLWLCLFPLGWLMGVPFPGAVRHLAATRRELIPWAWAMNGFFSVLSPLLAAIIARQAGFGAVFFLAAAAYGVASLAGSSFCASPTMGTKRTPPI